MGQRSKAATEMLPVRLIISVAMIATIVILMGFAAGNLRVFLAEQDVEVECRLLQTALCTMVVDGAFRDLDDGTSPCGTMRVLTLTFPDSLVYLSFGGDPDPSDTGSLTSGLLEDGAVIVYKIEGGSKKVIWVALETYKFRQGRLLQNQWIIQDKSSSLILTHGGTVSLVFECVQKNHQKYILIYPTDSMDF